VSIHFNKKTESDYLGAAFKKVCKIHRQLPPGGNFSPSLSLSLSLFSLLLPSYLHDFRNLGIRYRSTRSRGTESKITRKVFAQKFEKETSTSAWYGPKS
jgi:hypothetical protein